MQTQILRPECAQLEFHDIIQTIHEMEHFENRNLGALYKLQRQGESYCLSIDDNFTTDTKYSRSIFDHQAKLSAQFCIHRFLHYSPVAHLPFYATIVLSMDSEMRRWYCKSSKSTAAKSP